MATIVSRHGSLISTALPRLLSHSELSDSDCLIRVINPSNRENKRQTRSTVLTNLFGVVKVSRSQGLPWHLIRLFSNKTTENQSGEGLESEWAKDEDSVSLSPS